MRTPDQWDENARVAEQLAEWSALRSEMSPNAQSWQEVDRRILAKQAAKAAVPELFGHYPLTHSTQQPATIEVNPDENRITRQKQGEQ
jgi:hypothetical protein